MDEAGGRMGAVAEVWRYPVQSMRGESLAEAALSDRGVVGDRAYGLGSPVRLVVKRHAGVRSPYDHAAIHLLTTASCRALRRQHPEGRFEAARFRPNLVIDTGDRAGFVENQWIGREIAVGAARLCVTEHCVRCVMTVLAQGDLPEDPAILQTVREANETRAGVYAEVTRPGRVAVGDAATLLW